MERVKKAVSLVLSLMLVLSCVDIQAFAARIVSDNDYVTLDEDWLTTDRVMAGNTYQTGSEDGVTYIAITGINGKLNLPDSGQYCHISWSSSLETVIALDGTVTQPSYLDAGQKNDVIVTLTADLSYGEASGQKTFQIVVPALDETDEEKKTTDLQKKVEADSEAVQSYMNGGVNGGGFGFFDLNALAVNTLYLPTAEENASTVTWTSSDESLISIEPDESGGTDYVLGNVSRPDYFTGDQKVTLTARVAQSDQIYRDVPFQVTVKAACPDGSESVTYIKNQLTYDLILNGNDRYNVENDLYLPTIYEVPRDYGSQEYAISWTSSDSNTVTSSGKVIRPSEGSKEVTLTAEIMSKSDYGDDTTVLGEQSFTVTVVSKGLDTLALNFKDFSNAGKSLCVNGNGTATGIDSSDKKIFLKNDKSGGSVFTNQKIHLNDDLSFSTAFSFQINANATFTHYGDGGFTFTLQPESSSAYYGGADDPNSLGIKGVKPSVSIELDTNYSETPGPGQGNTYVVMDYLGVFANGDDANPIQPVTTLDLPVGSRCYAWIEYNGTTQTMEIRISDSPHRPYNATYTLSNVDLITLLAADNGLGVSDVQDLYAGFTGSAGDMSTEEDDIFDWYFKNDSAPIDFDHNTYADASAIALTAAPNANTGDCTLSVKVSGNDGAAAAGVPVAFSVSKGTLESSSATTDSEGRASVVMHTDESASGIEARAIAKGGMEDSATFSLALTPQYAVNFDKELLTDSAILGGNSALDDVITDLSLPTEGKALYNNEGSDEKSTIHWTSSDETHLFSSGKVTNPSPEDGDQTVTLEATITLDGASATKEFTVIVKSQDTADVNADGKWLDAAVLGGNSALENIKTNLHLPATGQYGSSIVWASSNTGIVKTDGTVTNPAFADGDQKVVLTATLTKGGVTLTKEINVTVKTVDASDTEAVSADASWLETAILNANTSLDNITSDLNLPAAGQNGSAITWTSSDESFVSAAGVVSRPAYLDGDRSVVLTASLTRGDASFQKTIKVIVKKQGETDAEKFQEDVDWVDASETLGDNLSQYSICRNLAFPDTAPNGSAVTWASSDPTVIADDGSVTRPDYETGDASVTMTATISEGQNTDTKNISYAVLSKPDLAPPKVAESSPADGSTGADFRTKEIQITFDEAIQAGTSNSKNYGIKLTGTNAPDFTVGITGKTLVITPASFFTSNATYQLTIPKDAVADLSGNLMAEDYSLSFTVETVVNEEIAVSSVTPADGSKDNKADGSISFSLAYEDGSEIKDSSNLKTSGNFNAICLTQRDGQTVPITRELNGNTVTIGLADGGKLEAGCVYTLSVPQNAVLDRFNNRNRAKTIQFAVASKTANPEVSNVYPTDGQTAVNINQGIIVTFSENVKSGVGSVALSGGSSGNAGLNAYWLNDRQCLLRPWTALAPNTDYTLKISYNFVKDSSSHSMIYDYTMSFTTGSNLLGVDSVSPLTTNDACGLPVSAKPEIVFSAPVDAAENAGKVTITDLSGNSVGFTAEADGNKVIFTPDSLLNAKECYLVSIPAGAFQSRSGATNDAVVFRFATGSKAYFDSYDSFTVDPSSQWLTHKALTFQMDGIIQILKAERRTVSSLSWNFGDGTAGSEETPVHTYASAGSYPVTLEVKDDYGFSYTFTQTVKIEDFDASKVSLSVYPTINQEVILSDSKSKYLLFTATLDFHHIYMTDEEIRVLLYKKGQLVRELATVTTGSGSRHYADVVGNQVSDYGTALFPFYPGKNDVGTYELVFAYGDPETGKSVRVPVTIVDARSTQPLAVKLYKPETGKYYETPSGLYFDLDGEQVGARKEWVDDDNGYCYVMDAVPLGNHTLSLSSTKNGGIAYYTDTVYFEHTSANCPEILYLRGKEPGVDLVTSSDGSSSDSYSYTTYIKGIVRPDTEFTIDGNWDNLDPGYYEYKISGPDGDLYSHRFVGPSVSLNVASMLRADDKLYFRMVSRGGIASDWVDAKVRVSPKPQTGENSRITYVNNEYVMDMPYTLSDIVGDTPDIFDGIPFLEDIDDFFGLSQKMMTLTAYDDGHSKYIKYQFPEEGAEALAEGFEIPVQISGTLVLQYNSSTSMYDFYYGFITVKCDLTKAEAKKEVTVPVIQVSAEGAVKMAVVIGGTFVIDNSGQSGNRQYSGILYFAPYDEASFQVGWEKANVTGYVDGGVEGQLHTTAYMSVDPYFTVGAKAKMLFFSKTLFEKTFSMHWDNGLKPVVYKFTNMMQSLDDDSAEVMSREYLNRGSEWLSHPELLLGAQADADDPKTQTIKTNLYPDSEVQLVRHGDELWMVWTDDNPIRSSMNRTQMICSVYKNGSWTDPKWIGADGTADFSPSAASTDNGVLMAWQDTGLVMPDDAKMSDYLQNSEISVTKTECTNEDSQPEIVTLTSDDQYDHSPKLAASGENALLVWTKSEGADGSSFETIMGNTADSSDSLYYSAWDGGNWSKPLEIEKFQQEAVVDSSIAMNGKEGLLLYTVDADHDPSTTDDNKLFARLFDGTSWGDAVQLAADGVKNPKAVYTGSDWLITWLQDGVLTYQNGLGGPPEKSSVSIENDYEITATNGTAALVYTEQGKNNTRALSAAFYNMANNSWSGEAPLAEDADGYVQSFSPVFTADGTLKVAYTQAEMETEAIDGGEYQNPSDKVDLKELDYTLTHDLALDSDTGLALSSKNPLPETVETVTATVLNQGDYAENATVRLYDGDPEKGGTLLAQTAADVPARSSKQVELPWVVNTTECDAYTLYAVVTPGEGVQDSNQGNNTVSQVISAYDAAITDVECEDLTGGSYLVKAEVKNNGSKVLTGVVLNLKDGETSLDAKTIQELYPGEEATICILIFADNLHADSSGKVNLTLTASLPDGKEDRSPDDNTYDFTAEPAPIVIQNSKPAQGDTKVDVNQKISVTFNMNVAEGSAFHQISLKDANLNQVAVNETLSGNTLTVTPLSPLDYDTVYTLAIPADAVGDSYGHVMEEDYTMSFTTTTSSPEVVFSYPGADMEGITLDSKIKMEYNQNISAGPSFKKILLLADSKTVSAAVTTDGKWLYVSPAGGLEKGTEYSLEVPSGAVVNSSREAQLEDYALAFDTTGTKEKTGGTGSGLSGTGGYTITRQTLADGSTMAVISVDVGDIAGIESSGTAAATVDIAGEVANDQSIRISLTKAAEDRLISDNKDLWIMTGKGDVRIPAAWFASLHAEGKSSMTLTITPSGGGAVDGLVSDGIYQFTLTAGGQRITKLDRNFTITIPLDKTRFQNAARVIARICDEAAGTWKPLGGTVNEENTALTFSTSNLSSFAAFETVKSFQDVTSSWAKEDVETLASRGLINGTSDTTFTPNGTITRAAFTTLMVRSLYVDTSESGSVFSDIPADSWCAGAVETAYRLGLVNGTGANQFHPNAKITREQLAAIVYRLYQYQNGTDTKNAENTFTDARSISQYARAAVNFVQETGIMQGSNNQFYPKRNTTRQEAAVVLYRLLKYMGQI